MILSYYICDDPERKSEQINLNLVNVDAKGRMDVVQKKSNIFRKPVNRRKIYTDII